MNQDNKQELIPGMTVEEIKAIFFDASSLREPPYKIYQLNSEGYRYYYRYNEQGQIERYPSVTTLLKQVMPTSPQLIEWIAKNGMDGATEKRDLAAAYGTFMHSQFEKLIISRKYDFDAVPEIMLEYMAKENLPEKFFAENISKIRKDVLAFAQFVRDYNVKPLAVEIGLVHPEYHYAGCVDLPCVMTDPKTGEVFRAIVDFKSGRKGFYEEHELQLHMYKDMWNVNFPDSPIVHVFNFSPKDWRTKPTYNLKEQTDSVNAKKLPYLLALGAIEDSKRDNTLTIVCGVLDLDKGKITDNILSLTLDELIKNRQKEAPQEPAEMPKTEDIPDLAKNKPVESEEAPEPIKVSSKAESAAKSKNLEKLPWEDEKAIHVEKNADYIKASTTFCEPKQEKQVDVDADRKAIEALEHASKDNLLNFEIEL